LQSYEDPQLCSVAVGLIGDICRALGEEAAPYCNTFMTVLLESLQSPVLDRQVKITIVSCFGDIAMSIGPNFEPYFSATMGVLRSAGEQTADPVSGTSGHRKWLLTVTIGGLQLPRVLASPPRGNSRRLCRHCDWFEVDREE